MCITTTILKEMSPRARKILLLTTRSVKDVELISTFEKYFGKTVIVGNDGIKGEVTDILVMNGIIVEVRTQEGKFFYVPESKIKI